MSDWSAVSRLQKCQTWLQFTCMRKFLNLHLPHHVEIVPNRDRTIKLVSYKPGKVWDITLKEAHTHEHPSKDSKMWARGVQTERAGARFCIILCKGAWHRGVVVDLRACTPALQRVRVGKVVLPWVRQGQYFEVFSTISELWKFISDREDLTDVSDTATHEKQEKTVKSSEPAAESCPF